MEPLELFIDRSISNRAQVRDDQKKSRVAEVESDGSRAFLSFRSKADALAHSAPTAWGRGLAGQMKPILYPDAHFKSHLKQLPKDSEDFCM
jgi:hypothetical protein